MTVDAGRFLEGRRCVANAALGLNASTGFGPGKPQNLEVALLNFLLWHRSRHQRSHYYVVLCPDIAER